MVDRNFNDVYQKLAELPLRRFAEVLRNKAQDITGMLATPAYFDQYPSKRVPWLFSRTFGPIGLTATRNFGDGGAFDQLAPVGNPTGYILPREGTIKTGRDAAFVWCASNAFAYLSWTYTEAPTFDGGLPLTPVNPVPAGDIFDPVFPTNGGAVVIPNIANANFSSPHVCFEMALYDKKRGRFLTDGKIPAESFVGGAYANKLVPKETRFNVDTEVEPRLTITEVRMGSPLDQAQPYSVASVAAYVNVVFLGYNILEEHFNETDTFTAIPSSRG